MKHADELVDELAAASRRDTHALFHHRYAGALAQRLCFESSGMASSCIEPAKWPSAEFRSLKQLLENRERFELVPDGAELFARCVAEFAPI